MSHIPPYENSLIDPTMDWDAVQLYKQVAYLCEMMAKVGDNKKLTSEELLQVAEVRAECLERAQYLETGSGQDTPDIPPD